MLVLSVVVLLSLSWFYGGNSQVVDFSVANDLVRLFRGVEKSLEPCRLSSVRGDEAFCVGSFGVVWSL